MGPAELFAVAKTAHDAFQLMMSIRDHIPNSDVISAHFDAEGSYLSGSEMIEVERTDTDEGRWLYQVKELPESPEIVTKLPGIL